MPEEHYHAVMQWVDRTSLGMRLVYYRVRPEATQLVSGRMHPSTVSEKLKLKPNTLFGPWLTKELRQRFSHFCCESMEQFSRETFAITQAGQIKSKGNRHEKDDRYAIDDRRRYILGFSNQKKIDVLAASEHELHEEIQFYKEEIADIILKQQESQERLNAVTVLEGITGFSDIDICSKEEEVREKEERRKKLEQGSDVLQALQCRLAELENKKITQENVLEKARKNETTLENKRDDYIQDKNLAVATAAEATPAMQEAEYPFLVQNKRTALKNKIVTMENIKPLERDYREWTGTEHSALTKDIQQLRSKIVKAMSYYNNQYAEETREVDPSFESLLEYARMLAQLENDGLPRFEKRFKQLLHENTINQIALFQAKLKQEQDTIKNRIEQINSSLSAIDYNEGRFIRLEYDETYDSDIKDFRVRLKACTEGALTGSDDEHYAETKFLQVKALIERFRGRPDIGNSLVIFGLGYGVDILKAVTWLKEKEIFYWGDLDTHGFAMLDQVRSFLPQTCSMLMDESTLFTHRDLWSVEDKPFPRQLTRLTPKEDRLFCLLQGNTWGKGVRLEQERVSFQQVKQFLTSL